MDHQQASTFPQTEQFMADIEAVCKKHNMAIVPTHNSNVSFHDPMTVVRYDSATEAYLMIGCMVRPDEL